MSAELSSRKAKHSKQNVFDTLVRARHLRSIILFALFAVVDLFLFVFALQGMVWLLFLRAAFALLVAHLAQPISEIQPWSSRQALTALTCFLLPGIGGLIAALWSTQVTRVQGAWQDVPVAQEVYRSSIDWGGVLDVVPLIDVLEGQDAQKKKRVLLQAQSMSSKIQVPVVRKALDDPDPEVRYYGASLLSRAEAAHSAQIRRLEKRLERMPEDVDAWNELATEYELIIEEGIAGAELSHFYLDKRLSVLKRSLFLNPDQPQVGIEKAQTLFFLKRYQEAEAEAKLWLGQRQAETADRARGVLIQLAYEQNDQELLIRLVREVTDVHHLPDFMQGLVQLWRREGNR